MTGVRHFWRGNCAGGDTGDWPVFNRVLKGIRRLHSGPPAKKYPIGPGELLAMHSRFSPAPFARALWACIVVTWWAMLRKSNSTSTHASPSEYEHSLRRSDIELDSSKHRLILTIRSSKTNQSRERPHQVTLQGKVGHPLDPVAAWQAHVTASPIHPTMAAFTFLESQRSQAMTYDTLRIALKRLMEAMGKSMHDVSSHSLRRGSATFAWHAGVPDVLLQAQGAWRSDCYKEYITLSHAAQVSVSTTMFDAVTSGHRPPMIPAKSPLGHVQMGQEDQEVHVDESEIMQLLNMSEIAQPTPPDAVVAEFDVADIPVSGMDM